MWKALSIKAKKGSKINVYNHHLATCPNRPTIIDDDVQINEKIDEILARHEKLKAKAEKKAFTCPYCAKVYKSGTLKHLLGCAKKNPEDAAKLKEFFENN